MKKPTLRVTKWLSDIPVEERSWLYLLRLAAFVLILGSVGMKNRRSGGGR